MAFIGLAICFIGIVLLLNAAARPTSPTKEDNIALLIDGVGLLLIIGLSMAIVSLGGFEHPW